MVSELIPAIGDSAARRASSAWLSSRRSIQILGAILVVISIGLFSGLAASNWRTMVDDAGRVAQNQVALLAENASRTIDVSNEVAELAIAIAVDRPWDEIAQSRSIRAKLRQISDRYEYINAIQLIDESGTLRMTTRESPAPDVNVAGRGHFQVQRERDAGLQISPVLNPGQADEQSTVLSRRINGPEGAFRGAAFVVLNPKYFERVYRDVRIRFATAVELFRNDLALLARYPEPAKEGDRARVDDLWIKKAPVRGLIDTSGPEGAERRLVAYEAVRRSPLYVSVTIGFSDITRNWVDSEIQQAIFAVAALGIILLFVSIAAVRCGHEADARAEVESLNTTLEDRVRERTAVVERLMAEMNHRVKNSLQMISGLLNIQARGTARSDVRQQLEEARNRVMMVARIHARLEQKDGRSSVRLDSLLRDVVTDLSKTLTTAEGAKIALDIDAAAVEVSVEKAAPIVLVLNELVTNAIKHSFPGGRSGRIWATLETSGTSAARMTVEDNGVGLPPQFDPAASTGLGMSLIVGLVHQLQGTMSHGASAKGGARFEIAFPLVDEEARSTDDAAAAS